jgi:hypothetical protein
MSKAKKKSRRLAFSLGILQVFIGLGAVAGGLGLVLEPDGSNLRLSLEWLRGSPFSNYLIPGLVLLVVNGLGSLAGGVASFCRYRYAGEIAVALGAFLMMWIVVQVWWVGLSSWLQPLYFGFGVLELVLGLLLRGALLVEENLVKTNP